MRSSTLMAMLKKGRGSKEHQKALAHIYDTHRALLLGRLSFGHFSLPTAEAEELYTKSFIIFDRKIAEGKEIENIGGYLWVILRNLAIKHLQKLKSDEQKSEKFQGSQDAVIAANEDLLASDCKKLFDKIKLQLSEKCIQILSLNAEGYSAAEIADKLSHKNSTVIRVLLQRCRKKVREIVNSNAALRQMLNELFPK